MNIKDIHISSRILNLALSKWVKLILQQQYMLSVLHSQYQACWCFADFRSLSSSMHAIGTQSHTVPSPPSEELINAHSVNGHVITHTHRLQYIAAKHLFILHMAVSCCAPQEQSSWLRSYQRKCEFDLESLIPENMWHSTFWGCVWIISKENADRSHIT